MFSFNATSVGCPVKLTKAPVLKNPAQELQARPAAAKRKLGTPAILTERQLPGNEAPHVTCQQYHQRLQCNALWAQTLLFRDVMLVGIFCPCIQCLDGIAIMLDITLSGKHEPA